MLGQAKRILNREMALFMPQVFFAMPLPTGEPKFLAVLPPTAPYPSCA